ncbi:hypothetical protein [Kosakonia sp.]|uniref:hypothetical protein n=1 Tax=Kosakonia sp. TaxID=1916651 RepID=UPI002899C90A|nr:hypothetical protein [Kosakonia sp.]
MSLFQAISGRAIRRGERWFSLVQQYGADGTNDAIAADNPLTAKIICAQSQPAEQLSSHHTLLQCADYDDGRMIIACRYVLMFPDGHTEKGSTDNEGIAEWHFAESAENIKLHILMD